MTVARTDSPFSYLINDADQHSEPPADVYERYIDPARRHMAIRTTSGSGFFAERLYNGRPARFATKRRQVVASDDQLRALGVSDRGSSATGEVVPGSLLNRLNPLRDLDDQGRLEFAKKYRELQPKLDTPDDRLGVMDQQQIHIAVNFATLPGIEVEFEDDLDAMYANLVAMNRYIGTEWSYSFHERLLTPPMVSFADPELALRQLDEILKLGVPKIIQTSTGPSMHRSPFSPENDRFWAICSEAGIQLATHLASATRYASHGVDWNEPEVLLGDMDAFQWVFYYGDRPAMETVGAAILQGWFSRFPKMKLLLAEQGAVWVPYIVRKMDHAFSMGRRATWGTLDRRPSEYFRDHCFVAPFPEENVERVAEVVGIRPLVFGSDFPHGEGLPAPSLYAAQISGLNDLEKRAVMSDNLARYLGLD